MFNGQGGEYSAVLTAAGKRSSLIRIGERIERDSESPLRIHLGIGLSRGERMDLVVQKATELGVGEISPILSERCEVKLDERRSLKRLQHWRKVAIGACEQSGRNLVPIIHAPSSLEDFLNNADAALKLVMHPEDAAATELPKSDVNSVAIVVGPEGGLTEQEVDQCTNEGFARLCLGPRVLRTETAPLAVVSILQYRWGDFNLL